VGADDEGRANGVRRAAHHVAPDAPHRRHRELSGEKAKLWNYQVRHTVSAAVRRPGHQVDYRSLVNPAESLSPTVGSLATRNNWSAYTLSATKSLGSPESLPSVSST
jgi:hypothetical protein